MRLSPVPFSPLPTSLCYRGFSLECFLSLLPGRPPGGGDANGVGSSSAYLGFSLPQDPLLVFRLRKKGGGMVSRKEVTMKGGGQQKQLLPLGEADSCAL